MPMTLGRLTEFLRHGSNAVALMLVLVLAVLATQSTLGASRLLTWAILGAMAFFLAEYGTHRFLLHARPAASRFVLSLQHRLHYDHHSEPERLDLLFLPLWFLIPALALYALIYYALSRSISITLAIVFGNLCALLYYEWVHYVAHIAYIPRSAWARWMKKYHLLHHFKNEHYWFGVTNPSMDYVSRTYARVTDVQRSSTTRDLFG